MSDELANAIKLAPSLSGRSVTGMKKVADFIVRKARIPGKAFSNKELHKKLDEVEDERDQLLKDNEELEGRYHSLRDEHAACHLDTSRAADCMAIDDPDELMQVDIFEDEPTLRTQVENTFSARHLAGPRHRMTEGLDTPATPSRLRSTQFLPTPPNSDEAPRRQLSRNSSDTLSYGAYAGLSNGSPIVQPHSQYTNSNVASKTPERERSAGRELSPEITDAMAHDFLDKLLRQRDQRAEVSRREAATFKRRAEASEARGQVLQRDFKTSRKNEQSLQQRLVASQANEHDLRQKLGTSEKNEQDLRQKLGTSRENEEDLQRQLGISRGNGLALQEQLDTSMRENFTLTEKFTSSTEENETLKTQVAASEDEKERLQQALAALQDELDENWDKIADCEERLQRYEAQDLEHTLRYQEARSDLAYLNERVLQLTNEHGRLLTFANARIAELTEEVVMGYESVWQFRQAVGHLAQLVGQNIAGFAAGIKG
ncbi:hypothetical protein C8Q79DRAFT_1013728 [Trametes meyenii]|nr:hypothetical protein C8Q79DRAFT_1013728 [Trametes meyenii]